MSYLQKQAPAAILITMRSTSGIARWLILNPPTIKQCRLLSPAGRLQLNFTLLLKADSASGETPAKRYGHKGWLISRTARRGPGISICSFWKRSTTAW